MDTVESTGERLSTVPVLTAPAKKWIAWKRRYRLWFYGSEPSSLFFWRQIHRGDLPRFSRHHAMLSFFPPVFSFRSSSHGYLKPLWANRSFRIHIYICIYVHIYTFFMFPRLSSVLAAPAYTFIFSSVATYPLVVCAHKYRLNADNGWRCCRP